MIAPENTIFEEKPVLSLSDRMKMYESNAGVFNVFPSGLPICVRIDGKAFHSFTRKMPKPFDPVLMFIFDETTRILIKETGASVGYTQSDEISLVFKKNDGERSQIFFNGRVQKMCSVLASMATAHFNRIFVAMHKGSVVHAPAFFDCRAFPVPSLEEVANYLVWRELDATRNSVSGFAQAKFSAKQLFKKNVSEMKQMLCDVGCNWHNLPDRSKYGAYFIPITSKKRLTVSQMEKIPPAQFKKIMIDSDGIVERRDVVRLVSVSSLLDVANRVDVLFNGKFPVPRKTVSSPPPAQPPPLGETTK